MDLDIRKAILHNLKDNSKDQLEATIVDAIEDGQEKLLPGLGVLFELIWKQSSDNEKLEMIAAIQKAMNN